LAMQDIIDSQQNELNRLRGILEQVNINPDAPLPPPTVGTDNDVSVVQPDTNLTPDTGFPRQITVRAGDSLARIANRYYGVSTTEIVNFIASHNGLANPNLIQQGQTLELPPLP